MIDRLLNLPAGARLVLFGLVAAAVLVLGYMTMTPGNDRSTTGSTRPTATREKVVVPEQPGSTIGAPQENQFVTDPTTGVALDLSSPVKSEDIKVAAGRAVEFTNLYLSYRFDQNDTNKVQALHRLMAGENSVDLSSVAPTGPVASVLVKDQTVVDAKVTELKVSLISASTITTDVHVHTKTTALSGPKESDAQFSVTLSYDGNRDGWFVSGCDSTNSAFQDEIG